MHRSSGALSEPLTFSLIVPATNRPECLGRCVAAVHAAADAPEEVIVVEEGSTSPAAIRNAGAQRATGDVLVFIDADVEVHPDAFSRMRAAFREDPELVGLFGSYDDDPAERGAVSGFRNLLHHHVHQGAPGPCPSFWAGLGAIRSATFHEVGGFVEHPIEDVELGIRLAARGDRVVLDPRIQGKHLKHWTLRSMIRTDFAVRGVPWVRLTVTQRSSATMLNLSWRNRLSVIASVATIGGLLLRKPSVVLSPLAALLTLNHTFYGLLLRRRGPAHAAAGVGLHVVHHLVSACALPTGLALEAAQLSAGRRQDQKRVTVGKPALPPGEVPALGLEHPQGDGAAQPGRNGRGDPVAGLGGRLGDVAAQQREERGQDVDVREAPALEPGIPQRRGKRFPAVGAPVIALPARAAGPVGADEQRRPGRHDAPQLQEAAPHLVLVDVLQDVVHDDDVEGVVGERQL